MAPRAKVSFMYEKAEGGSGYVAVNQMLPDDHEAVTGREGLFFTRVEDPADPFAETDEKPVAKTTRRKS